MPQTMFDNVKKFIKKVDNCKLQTMFDNVKKFIKKVDNWLIPEKDPAKVELPLYSVHTSTGKAAKFLEKAVKQDKEKHYKEALALYEEACHWMFYALEHESAFKEKKKKIRITIEECQRRIKTLWFFLNEDEEEDLK